MIRTVLLLATMVVVAIAHHGCDRGPVIKRAIVRLEGNGVTGSITFTQQDDGNVRVSGQIVGMEKGFYGTHIHETGDLSQGCMSTKAHFNPDGHDHGHPNDEIRHAGDLGNVEFDDSKVANVDFVDRKIALSGIYNILGRALVLHERADDFGKSAHPDSKKTGNAGGRVACGVIGILTEEPGVSNSAIASCNSLLVLPLVLFSCMS